MFQKEKDQEEKFSSGASDPACLGSWKRKGVTTSPARITPQPRLRRADELGSGVRRPAGNCKALPGAQLRLPWAICPARSPRPAALWLHSRRPPPSQRLRITQSSRPRPGLGPRGRSLGAWLIPGDRPHLCSFARARDLRPDFVGALTSRLARTHVPVHWSLQASRGLGCRPEVQFTCGRVPAAHTDSPWPALRSPVSARALALETARASNPTAPLGASLPDCTASSRSPPPSPPAPVGRLGV